MKRFQDLRLSRGPGPAVLATSCSAPARANGSRSSTAQTLSGWTKGGRQGQQLGGQGRRHRRHRRGLDALQPQDLQELPFRAELKINDHGNSGMYFRCPAPDGDFCKGYEAQIDSTHSDPIRTGSLYTFVHIYKQLVPPDTWFTYEIEVVTKDFRGQRGSAHQGLDQRQAALRVPRSHQHLEGGPLRLPAARPGQPGRDPQDRGHGVTLTTTSMV